MHLFVILGLLCMVFLQSRGQGNFVSASHPQEAGTPLIQNYTPEVYGAFDQNWAVVQDSASILYFGNGDGVLVYDGVYWELITLPNQGTVFSLALDEKNRVYVGGNGEVGYLEADHRGQMGYVSLLSFLSEEDQQLLEVRETFATPEGVFFRTPHALFLWTGENFKVWRAEGKRVKAFWVNNTMMVHGLGKGLMHLHQDILEPVPEGEFFADKVITCILPYDKHRILIGTFEHGLYRYDRNHVTSFITESDAYLREHKLYKGIILHDSTFALGTLEGGLVILDKTGKQRLLLNERNGLSSPMVLALYQDREGMLWTGLNSGIAKIEYPSPFTRFDAKDQLNGNVSRIIRYQDTLYVATDRGLYYADFSRASHGPVFQQFPGFTAIVWDLLPVHDRLLVAIEYNIQQIIDGQATKISDRQASRLIQSQLDSNRVFAGLSDGITSLYFRDGVWEEEGKIPNVYGVVTDIIETSEGTLWLETNVNHIFRISFQNKNDALHMANPWVETFGINQGLPDDVGHLFNLEGTIIFVSIFQDETYRFDETSQSFQLFPAIGETLGIAGKRVEVKKVDAYGNVWCVAYDAENRTSQVVAWKQQDGTYQIEDLEVARVHEYIDRDFYPELDDGVIWFGGKGLTRLDPKISWPPKVPFKALIRKVSYQGDSILFGGAKPRDGTRQVEAILPFEGNNFRFLYASPSYANEKANQFQYVLEGFDADWSAWTTETRKDYTNLPEGKYTFKVRARNLHGQAGEEDSYHFVILPPWYRTWWAYLFYALALLGCVGWVVRWRSARLQREKEALEETIQERTEEIRQKNAQLAQQASQLKEMDQLKSRLFANISHEFRTPLTLIKGPMDQLLQHPEKTLSQANVQMIRRNTDRLLRLVNQLLDLSKLDAGKLEVTATAGDVYKLLRTIGAAFSSHAEQRGIAYRLQIPQQTLFLSFDHDKLEQIVYNLLSNAFKFTPEAGEIKLYAVYREPWLTLEVADHGKGIPADRLPYIFDRFYQVDDSYTREQEGTGIGLALTKELIVLMGGKVMVQSEPGKGTTFTVNLPLARAIADEKFSNSEKPAIPQSFAKDEVTMEESVAADQPPPEEPAIVLVVEDNTDMRNFIKEHLANEYEVLEAVHGKEGLNLALERIPDLVITDLMMPQTDGIMLSRQLKTDERTSHIPVIMLTARAGQEHKIEGLETGVDDYLTKPFSVAELKVRVKNLIAQRAQLRKKFSREITLQPGDITITQKDALFLQNAIRIVEEHMGDDQFTVEEFQKHMGMSRMQLHRKLKALTDQPASEFIRLIRMKRAAQLFMQKEVTVSEIAYEVGFTDPSYFAKCFKEVHGITPKEYIQKIHIQQ